MKTLFDAPHDMTREHDPSNEHSRSREGDSFVSTPVYRHRPRTARRLQPWSHKNFIPPRKNSASTLPLDDISSVSHCHYHKMDTPTTNIGPTVSSNWTNSTFNENWLPGISFSNEDDILINTNENQVEETINTTTTTATMPLHQIQARRITPLASPVNHHTFQSPTHRCRASETSRHVHFACHESLETCHAPPIISVLTEDEIRTLWWQSPELLQMKRFTRSLMMNGNTEDCVGLDRFTTERTAYKKRAVRLVLLAQHQQRTHTISDNPEEFIRAVSRRCSHWTRNIARTIAQHIHNEINFIERGDQVKGTPTSTIGLEAIPVPAVAMALELNPTPGSNASPGTPNRSSRKRSHFGIEESSTNTYDAKVRRVLPKL